MMKQIKILFFLLITVSFIACFYINKNCGKDLPDNIFLYESLNDGNVDARIENEIRKILDNIDNGKYYQELDILNPYDGTIFPLDIASPIFTWKDQNLSSTRWLVAISFENKCNMIYALTDKSEWTPDKYVWEVIKKNSIEREANIIVFGINSEKSFEITSKSKIAISISQDDVRAPIFYKQVPPHFGYAYKHPEVCKWRLGDISSYGMAPVVLEKMLVCVNCHSFSSDGKIFGIDIDYQNDKGAYVLTPTREKIELSGDDFITWNDFPNPDDTINMGLFSRVSPDGNYVVSTVHEKNYMALINDLNFSQLFFTYKGIIAIYSSRDSKFVSLPGADDPNYVQTSPAWSPDGKYIVFSRARVNKELIDYIDSGKSLDIAPGIRIEDLNRKYQIRYDLYRVAFNAGKGGTPEHIKGASNNGRSNYCARYSPDGKWIVYNQSESGLLLQPDSQLYIIPAQGGIARKMRCNTDIMNSWHSWSPNSRWLVFASKVNSAFTELFLTHVDENGDDSPPVLLWRLNSKEYAATIPEFTNSKAVSIRSIILLNK